MSEGVPAGLARPNRTGPGLTAEEVADIERVLGVALPQDYVRFLRWGDGWEGWVGASYLRLHGRDELSFANDIDFREAFPSLVAIGGDGGLETYALDFRSNGSTPGVVAIDRNSSDEADIWPLAASFTEAVAVLGSRTPG